MKLLLFILIIFYHNSLFAQDRVSELKNFIEVKEFVKTIRPEFSFIDLENVSSQS